MSIDSDRVEAVRLFVRRHGGRRVSDSLLADMRFVARVVGGRHSIDRPRLGLPDGGIDAEALASQFAVEHHSARAEQYFRGDSHDDSHDDSPTTDFGHLLKPFTDPLEAANHLAAFAALIGDLGLARGQRVLDFGSGNGWTSRLLMQLGCQVILCDVSPTALNMAAESLRTYPPITRPTQGPPEFLLFDGRTLELPDGSVDRIACFDAFHHVANRDSVLAEMYRVLADGGRAGFHEPGPDHSRKPSSQFEMANHGFLERDIRLGEISELARQVGFSAPQLSLAAPVMTGLGLAELNRFLRWSLIPLTFRRLMWDHALGTRLFYLDKGRRSGSDSRQTQGLRARIDLVAGPRLGVGDDRWYRIGVTNAGSGRWLPSSEAIGGVWLGLHRYDADGTATLDVQRWPLPGRGVAPGESIEVEIEVPTGVSGERLALDLVAEQVTWFVKQGSRPFDLPRI